MALATFPREDARVQVREERGVDEGAVCRGTVLVVWGGDGVFEEYWGGDFAQTVQFGFWWEVCWDIELFEECVELGLCFVRSLGLDAWGVREETCLGYGLGGLA